MSVEIICECPVKKAQDDEKENTSLWLLRNIGIQSKKTGMLPDDIEVRPRY